MILSDNASVMGLSNSDYEIFIVSKSSSANSQHLISGTTGPGVYDLQLNGGAGLRFTPVSDPNYSDLGTNGTYTNGAPYIFGASVESNIAKSVVNGLFSTDTETPGRTTNANVLNIGRKTDGSSFYNGQIGEAIVYNVALSTAERSRVLSYLAIKYGITLDQTTATDYLASNGTTKMWDATVAGTFKVNIAGIGRDDDSGLNQKQSISGNSGAIVSMGLGTIANDNAANSNSFGTDRMFVTWAHNSASATFANVTNTQLPADVAHRMTRVWQAQENNGDAGNLQIKFDLTSLGFTSTTAGDYVLLVSTSSTDFSSATATTATSITSNVATFDNVNITNGVYFTIANKCSSLTAGTIGTNATICSGTAAATLTSTTAASGLSGITYQWESSIDGTNFSDIAGANAATFSPGTLSQTTHFRRKANANTCTATSNTVTITVNTIQAGAIAGTQSICTGTTPTALSSTTDASASSAVTYQWESSTDGTTFSDIAGATATTYSPSALTQTTTFRRKATANGCTLTTAAVTITVSNLLPGVIGSAQTVCPGVAPATFTSDTDVSGATTITYQWQSSTDGVNFTDIAGATETTYTSAGLTQNTSFRRNASGGGCNVSSNIVAIAVGLSNPITPAVTVISNKTNNEVKVGEGIVFTAQTSNTGDGAETLTYQWKINGMDFDGATQSTFTINGITLKNQDKISVVITTDFNCVSSNTATSSDLVVLVNNENALQMPNIFTPNGDGHNDEFNVLLNQAPSNINFRILDAHNQVVYQTQDVSEAMSTGWKGTKNGREVPNGRYIWFIEFTATNGQKVTAKGFVILAR